MNKRERELLRLAHAEGVERPRIVPGGAHPRLTGTVAGKVISLPVSVTKAFAGPRAEMMTRRNIRDEVARVKGGAA